MRIRLLTISTIIIAVFFGTTGTGKEKSPAHAGPSLDGATGWVNSQALSLQALQGKVVLIDFWTYTCINWRRTLPYVREWASKYRSRGLVVIGVHTPEFEFEKNIQNVNTALKEMNISYPVGTDNDFKIWRSFDNQYWPALYLIDAKGKIRYKKFGEGGYTESELQIQKLLNEISSPQLSLETAAPASEGFEAQADWNHLGSPETYLGFNRTRGFVSNQSIETGVETFFTTPPKMKLNQWTLLGKWTMQKDFVHSSVMGSRIIYRFHARDLHLIMGASKTGAAVRFRVSIDGMPPAASHGLDVDSSGNGTMREHRMYQLIRQQGPIIDREFQIEFLDPDVEVYDFTFG